MNISSKVQYLASSEYVSPEAQSMPITATMSPAKASSISSRLFRVHANDAAETLFAAGALVDVGATF